MTPPSLGSARGSITIDTSDLERTRQVTRRVSADITRDLGGIDRGARQAATGVNGLSGEFSRLGPIIAGTISVATLRQVAQMAIQLDAIATSYRRQEVAALSLAGSQEKLNELLRTYDSVTGGAIGKAQALADVTQLQAIGFADTTAELEQFLRAARGISIATGRTQDYVISQLQLAIANQSTLRLDQIALGVEEVQQNIEELRASNRGLTTEMAYQQAILSLAEEKFGALVDSVEGQATGAEKARKAWEDFRLSLGEFVGPATGTILGGLTAEIEGILERLQEVSRAAKQARFDLDRLGIGGGGDRAPGQSPPWWRADPLGDWMRRQGTGAQGVEKIQSDIATREMMRESFARIIEEARESGDTATVTEFESKLRAVNAQLADLQPRLRVAQGLAPPLPTRSGGIGPSLAPAPVLPDGSGVGAAVDAKLVKAQVEYFDAVQAVERQANESRLSATRQYEQQRTDTIAEFEKSIAREAEDHARQRLRAEQTLARNIADVREDAARREAEAQEDLDERLADLREDTSERIAEIEQDAARDRERRERDHRDRLLNAAARLDAGAVAEEQRRFARESQDARENLERRVGREQENLQERIEQEHEAHQERLEEAREADERRIQDMQEAFAEQRRIEDEDRQIRLDRQAEDHQDQLAQMDRAHGERLAQIDRQQAQEMDALQRAFMRQLQELGQHNTLWLRLQELRQQESLKLYDKYLSEMNKKLAEETLKMRGITRGGGIGAPGDPLGGSSDAPVIERFAMGGAVRRTGPAMVHAGEHVLNPQTVNMLRMMTGGPVTQAGIVQAIAGSNGRGLTIGQLTPTIILGDVGNRSDAHIMGLVEDGMMRVFERLA